MAAPGPGERASAPGAATSASSPGESSWLTLAVEMPGVEPWRGPRVRLYQKVRVLERLIRAHFGLAPADSLRLYSGRTRLAPNRLLHDYHRVHDGSTVRVRHSVRDAAAKESAGYVAAVVRAQQDIRVDSILNEVSRGFARGCVPRLTLDGCGGTYLMSSGAGGAHGNAGPAAVFKPEEEEAGAPQNPRGYVGKMGTAGMKKGVRSGEGAVREVAAALMDRDGFCGVPPTALVELYHPSLGLEAGRSLSRSVSMSFGASTLSTTMHVATSPESKDSAGSGGRLARQAQGQGRLGSLQGFVKSVGVAGDYGSGVFPTQEVQKIALLDIRWMNLDRHDANILVQVGHEEGAAPFHLTPIDHGNILPDTLLIMDYEWVWLDWPQVRLPLTEDCRRAVARMDAVADTAYLDASLGIRPACLTVARLSSMLLKQGVGAGLTLFEIASMIVRMDEEERSLLEQIYTQAHRLAHVRRRCDADGGEAAESVATAGLALEMGEGGSGDEVLTSLTSMRSGASSVSSSSSGLSRAVSTPSLRLVLSSEPEPEPEPDPERQPLARGLSFTDDDTELRPLAPQRSVGPEEEPARASAPDPDDSASSASSYDSSTDEDEQQDEVPPFDPDKGREVGSGTLMRRSRSVHASAAGSPLRSGLNKQLAWRHRRSPASALSEGDAWLAPATPLAAAGLRPRDVVHDEAFFGCFAEVAAMAIQRQLSMRRRRASSDGVAVASTIEGRSVDLRRTASAGNAAAEPGLVVGSAPETVGRWVPPHRRSAAVK